jgi:hypothetical protein
MTELLSLDNLGIFILLLFVFACVRRFGTWTIDVKTEKSLASYEAILAPLGES